MKYRMIALDCDGTLLDPTGRVRPAVSAAVREAMRRGVLVTLATGRRFDSAQAIAREVGVELPLVLHGGTVIQDSETGEVLYEDVMDTRLLSRVVDEVLGEGQQPVLYTSPAAGGSLVSGPPEHDNAATESYLGRQPNVLRLAYAELRAAKHVISVGVFEDDDVLRGLYGRLGKWPEVKVLLWEPDPMYPDAMYLLDVLNAGCSKAKALEHLAGKYGISMSEVMAVGDQINDFEMLESAGLGVAMGNAIPLLQDRANVVVGTNDEDGVAEAIHRYVLNGAVGERR